MLNRVYWKIPGQILVLEVIDEVMLQDVKDITREIRATIDADEHRSSVDVLFDLTHVTGYKPETMNIKNLFGAVKKHERVRWNIIVNPNPNPVIDFMIRTLVQLFKTQLSIVPTVEAAVTFIETKQMSNQV